MLLLEEPHKALLIKMMVGRESLANATATHQNEADRIAQRVGLVESTFQQLEGRGVQASINPHGLDGSILVEMLQEFQNFEARKLARTRQRNELGQDVAVGQPARSRSIEGDRPLVLELGAVEQTEEAGGIEEHQE